MKSLLFTLVVFLSVSAFANPVVRIQYADEIEMLDTVFAVGEIIYIGNGDEELKTTSIRIGDGVTPGGYRVASDWAMLVPVQRLLDRGEYTVTLADDAILTNGVYKLIIERSASVGSTSNFGSLAITADVPISAITYDYSLSNARIYQSLTDAELYSGLNTNVVITGVEQAVNYSDPAVFSVAVSNVAVYAWDGSHLVGNTNDVRYGQFLVRDPLSDYEAVNRKWHNTALFENRGENWSGYSATNAVDLSWQPLWVNPYSYFTATNAYNMALMYRESEYTTPRKVIDIELDNDTITVLSCTYNSTSVVMWVDAAAEFSSAPVIQRYSLSTNLVTGAWTNLTDSVSTWPDVAYTTSASGLKYKAYRVSASFPAEEPNYLRVAADIDTAAKTVDKLNFNGVMGTDFLQLDPQTVFPSWGTTGTVVWITSGATNKPYAYDGSVWNPLW